MNIEFEEHEDYIIAHYSNGDKEYMDRININFHREDGPALEYANGDKRWFINGVEYPEDQYLKIIKLKAFW